MSRNRLEEPLPVLLHEVDPHAELSPCGLTDLVIGGEATGEVGPLLDRLLAARAGAPGGSAPAGPGGRARVVLLVDATPIRRDGVDLKDRVQRELAERFDVVRHVLDDGHPQLHVVDEVVAEARAAVTGADAVVALGGGTISDIAKLAATLTSGPAPVLMALQTAASVDGFTDDVSVVLRDGVKRTVASRWPDAVVADGRTIADAPPAMNRAGFGEMTSMLVAPADWRLACLVGTDTTYKQASVDLLALVGADIDDWAPGVRTAEPASLEALTRALALRGVVTGVSGTTAVLSGVEHLVSHMLDQHHSQDHQPLGLHGAQVGVAGVLAAAAWELLLERLAADPDRRTLPVETLRERGRIAVGDAFDRIDPSGRVAVECWGDYSRKLDALAAAPGRLDAVVADWATHAPRLRGLVRSSAAMAAWLGAAGAPLTFADLDPVVSPELGRWALSHCALMRNRFTVVDLLTSLGWWADADVDEVLRRAEHAVAGATMARSVP